MFWIKSFSKNIFPNLTKTKLLCGTPGKLNFAAAVKFLYLWHQVKSMVLEFKVIIPSGHLKNMNSDRVTRIHVLKTVSLSYFN